MTYKIISGGIPSNKQKYPVVHTAFLKEIAVFFYSADFILFILYSLLYDSKFKNCALVFERVRFFYAIKKSAYVVL